MKFFLGLLLLTTVTFIACKKDKELTTEEKVLGKWYMKSVITNDYYSGATHYLTYLATPTDYMDFKTGGSVTVSLGASLDTLGYAIIDQSHLWISVPSDSYEIKSLTKSSFVMYIKQDNGGGDYTEFTFNMIK